MQPYLHEFDYDGYRLYWPCRPESVTFAWAGLEIPPGVAEPNSFFVPQSDDGEGALAFPSFRTCPDVDGIQVLKRHARIKVVARDTFGDGIPGIGASDILILLNGGTTGQGYIGEGADSILASSTLTTLTHCPDLRAIMADGPTDASGTTYITFIGAGGQRDSTRKWGNVDFEMPVYVLGTKIAGQLATQGAAHNSYTLHIRNTDAGYYGTDYRYLENVTSFDNNWLHAHPYWDDFTGDGIVNSLDLNFWKAHNTHDCRHPVEY